MAASIAVRRDIPDTTPVDGAIDAAVRGSGNTVTACHAIVDDVLTLRMNDAAVGLIGALDGAPLTPPDGLAYGLKARAAAGIQRHGKALKWAHWIGEAAGTLDEFPDLTSWECVNSSFQLEDLVDVSSTYADHQSPLSDDDQRILLRQGIALALEVARMVGAPDLPVPVRCIISANDVRAMFRFHQIRPGECWRKPSPDRGLPDKVIEVDIDPLNG
jgi:hypothetical protein